MFIALSLHEPYVARSFSFPALISFIPFLPRVPSRAEPPRELSASFFPDCRRLPAIFVRLTRVSSRFRESVLEEGRDGGENEACVCESSTFTRVYSHMYAICLGIFRSHLYIIKNGIKEISAETFSAQSLVKRERIRGWKKRTL